VSNVNSRAADHMNHHTECLHFNCTKAADSILLPCRDLSTSVLLRRLKIPNLMEETIHSQHCVHLLETSHMFTGPLLTLLSIQYTKSIYSASQLLHSLSLLQKQQPLFITTTTALRHSIQNTNQTILTHRKFEHPNKTYENAQRKLCSTHGLWPC
jgi:hypothetical protein